MPRETYSNRLPTIGRPIANTQIYILDEDLQPVPVHVAGEIYVGGAGVARGYLNQPELTAEKFVRNPFSNDPSARVFIEPATWRAIWPTARLPTSDASTNRSRFWAIASSLTRLSPCSIVIRTCRRAASWRVQDACCEKHLVAYVVLNPGAQPAAADLRSFLEKELPQYMVPAVFVRLDELSAHAKRQSRSRRAACANSRKHAA